MLLVGFGLDMLLYWMLAVANNERRSLPQGDVGVGEKLLLVGISSRPEVEGVSHPGALPRPLAPEPQVEWK